MKLISLLKIQFRAILEDIQSYLSNMIGGTTNISQSSVFGQLITVVSGIAHNIMLYIEDSLGEQNKYTSSRKKSIFGLAALTGYFPSLGKCAGVWLRISPKPHNESSLDCILTDRTRLMCSQNGLYYVLVLDTPAVTLNIDSEMSNHFYYAIQGRQETQRFVTTGGKLQTVNVQYAGFIDLDYFEVKVNGETWEKVASLYDMDPNGKQYSLAYNPTGGVDVMFGNGRYGAELVNEDVIDTTYICCNGEDGNIDTTTNTYFIFTDKLKDVQGNEIDGNSVFDIRFATNESVASGSDAEDVSTVSRMMGFNSRSLVLADSNNYKRELSKYSFIGYNRTFSLPGSLVIRSIVLKNYQSKISEGSEYFDLTDNDFYLSDLQKTSIVNAIEASGSQLAGTTYEILDMELVKYAIYIYIRLKDSSSDHNVVETKIKNAVGLFMSQIEDRDTYIPKSDIERSILDNVDEVDGINIYFLNEENESAIKNGYYIKKTYKFDASNGTFNIIKTTVPVYAGENPNLNLSSHGDILLERDDQYPILSGGWTWRDEGGNDITTQPITIVFEN